MQTMGERIRQAREEAGINQSQLAKTCGVSRAAASQWELGVTEPTRINIVNLARALNVEAAWLTEGIPPKRTGRPQQRLVDVVGYVGAGAQVFLVDDQAKGELLEQVPAPPGYDDSCVAVRVRGESLYPQVEDGWLIYYAKDADGVDQSALGRLCVVKVASGEMLVKKVFQGSKKHHYRLDSVNAPARHDVRLEWAAPVIAIVPK